MKKLFCVFAAAAVLMGMAACAPKEDNSSKKESRNSELSDRIRAEQIKFIGDELELTDAEAERFWPVYNKAQDLRRERVTKFIESMKALKEGIENGQDTKKLVRDYMKAKMDIQKADSDAICRYSKVLPPEKVAKLVVAEERFRNKRHGLNSNRRNNGSEPAAQAGKPDEPRPEGMARKKLDGSIVMKAGHKPGMPPVKK